MTADFKPQLNWHPMLWIGIAALLLVPLVAMQFTREVNWTGFDFVAAALLLGVPALIFEVASPRIRSAGRRALLAVALVAVTGLLWAQGAVGIV